MSSAIAFIATCLISPGAAKSGNPCERFTAPCFIASRVISRITDSVNRLALWDTCRCCEGAGVVMGIGFGFQVSSFEFRVSELVINYQDQRSESTIRDPR